MTAARVSFRSGILGETRSDMVKPKQGGIGGMIAVLERRT